jgi:hypothetical protein
MFWQVDDFLIQLVKGDFHQNTSLDMKLLGAPDLSSNGLRKMGIISRYHVKGWGYIFINHLVIIILRLLYTASIDEDTTTSHR